MPRPVNDVRQSGAQRVKTSPPLGPADELLTRTTIGPTGVVHQVNNNGTIIYRLLGDGRIQVPVLAEHPSTPLAGQMYIVLDTLYVVNSSNVPQAVGSGSGGEAQAVEYLAQNVSLTDGQNFTLTNSGAGATGGIVVWTVAAPSTVTGQVVVEIYGEVARTNLLGEIQIDLTDSSTYSDGTTIGFVSSSSTELYGVLRCSGVPAAQTIDLTLTALLTSPPTGGAPVPPYGDGLQADLLGNPEVALASDGGLEFDGGQIQIKPDPTAAVRPTTGAGGCAITGALDTTTVQTVTVVKRFAGVGLTPRGTTGAPTTGTWAAGDEILDSEGVRFRCTVGGTPGTWELADVVTREPADVLIENVASGATAVAYLPVDGPVGVLLSLQIAAHKADGSTGTVQSPFRVRVYRTSDVRARDVMWQGQGLGRQTSLSTDLTAGLTVLDVVTNDIVEVDEGLAVWASDVRYEFARCVGRPTGDIQIGEALVDAGTFATGSLVLPISEWTNIPWLTTDGNPLYQNTIVLQVRHDGPVTDPNLDFIVRYIPQSRGVVR